jgi:hypothetical protein
MYCINDFPILKDCLAISVRDASVTIKGIGNADSLATGESKAARPSTKSFREDTVLCGSAPRPVITISSNGDIALMI